TCIVQKNGHHDPPAAARKRFLLRPSVAEPVRSAVAAETGSTGPSRQEGRRVRAACHILLYRYFPVFLCWNSGIMWLNRSTSSGLSQVGDARIRWIVSTK